MKFKREMKQPTLSVTVADVMKWQPCGWDGADNGKNYTEARVCALFAGRKRLTALDVLALDIPVEDRLWAVLREELIDACTLRLFGCDCAERDLARRKKSGETIRPEDRAAIRVSRRYAVGKATLTELAAAGAAAGAARAAAGGAARDAARGAAWDAARGAAGAARDAARGAAGNSAGDAARDIAWAAAWKAEREWQVAHLRAMLMKEGYR